MPLTSSVAAWRGLPPVPADERVSSLAGAEAELDDTWVYIARESGSIDVATGVVDGIAERFWLLARHPHMGRRRDDVRSDLRSLTVGNYVIIRSVVENGVVLILHVVHGSRDVVALFGP